MDKDALVKMLSGDAPQSVFHQLHAEIILLLDWISENEADFLHGQGPVEMVLGGNEQDAFDVIDGVVGRIGFAEMLIKAGFFAFDKKRARGVFYVKPS